MPSRNGTLKQVRIAVRLSPQDHEKIERALKDKGYANVSTFIRAAIDNEIGRRTELLDAEQRIAASFDRLSRDVFRVARGQQALFALVDALTKTILTCMPEPWSEQQKIEFAAPEYLRNVIRIVTETGLRIYKELTPMKKGQLDLVNRTVWIPDSKTPNGVAEVPLTDIAVDAFRNQVAISGPGPYLFPSDENASGHQKTFKTAWHAMLRRAKVPYFRIYDLRSTYATRLSAGGVADEWVTQLLRQGDAKVFKKYSQMKLQMKREALAKLNRQANETGPGFGTAQCPAEPGFGTVLA